VVRKSQAPAFHKPQTSFQLFRLAAAIVVTMDAIKRLLSEFRPADWAILIVDLLVLVVIVIEYVHQLRRERKESRRQKIIDERVQAIRKAILEGQKLQRSSVPYMDPGTAAWFESVKKWTGETQLLLASYSPQAEASFTDISSMVLGNVGNLRGAQSHYNQLLAQLTNLRGIMEKPEVYLNGRDSGTLHPKLVKPLPSHPAPPQPPPIEPAPPKDKK